MFLVYSSQIPIYYSPSFDYPNLPIYCRFQALIGKLWGFLVFDFEHNPSQLIWHPQNLSLSRNPFFSAFSYTICRIQKIWFLALLLDLYWLLSWKKFIPPFQLITNFYPVNPLTFGDSFYSDPHSTTPEPSLPHQHKPAPRLSKTSPPSHTVVYTPKASITCNIDYQDKEYP